MLLSEPIRTERLLLRSLSESDATPSYLAWMQNPEVLRYLEARLAEHTLDSLRGFIASANASATELLLGICLLDGRHIGNIKLGPVNVHHRHAAVGLLIGERVCWGQGYANEAIRGLTDHAFRAMRLEKLYAGCYASNVGSYKAFLRAGYIQEARQKGFWSCEGRREDNIQLGVTRPDWQLRGP